MRHQERTHEDRRTLLRTRTLQLRHHPPVNANSDPRLWKRPLRNVVLQETVHELHYPLMPFNMNLYSGQTSVGSVHLTKKGRQPDAQPEGCSVPDHVLDAASKRVIC